MKTPFTDKEIIAALRQNNKTLENKVLRQLYPQHYNIISRLVTNNSGNEDDALHTFHDGLIGLLKKSRKEDFILKCSISTLLYSICRNIWLNELRKRKKNMEVSLNESLPWKLKTKSIQKQLEIDQGNKFVHKILEELNLISSKCYKIIKSFYFDGKGLNDLKVELNIATVGATKSQKGRCIEKLKNEIKGDQGYQNYLRDFLMDLYE